MERNYKGLQERFGEIMVSHILEKDNYGKHTFYDSLAEMKELGMDWKGIKNALENNGGVYNGNKYMYINRFQYDYLKFLKIEDKI